MPQKEKSGCLKKILIALAVLVVLGAIGGAIGGKNDSSGSSKSSSSTVGSAATVSESESASSKGSAVEEEEATTQTTYKDIYDKYAKKIRDKTPKLVEQYNKKAATLSDIQDKAALCNKKIQVLAEIETEGMEKMAEIKLFRGDKGYDKWTKKLYSVYEEQAQQITDAYMSTAM